MKKRILFDETMISRMITRIANEIIEQNKLDDIVLVGIQILVLSSVREHL